MTSTVPIFTSTLSTSIATAPSKFSVGENDRSQASQLRIVTIVMTAFNIVCAASIIFRILWDARRVYMKRRWRSRRGTGGGIMGERTGKLDNGSGKRGGVVTVKEVWDGGEKGGKYAKEEGVEEGMGGGGCLIPAIEIFPLVLGGAMLAQGILLAFVESAGLDGGPVTKNCGYLSEVAWVAQWITPYVVFSFTLEAFTRAIFRPRFKRRSATAVATCIVLALFLLLITWVPSRAILEHPENDTCSGQLMSYTDHVAVGGLGIIVVLLLVSVIMGAVVLMRLRGDCGVDKVEKISTSRTVYFLIVNVPQWIMMVPNYAVTAKSGPEHGLAYLATFIINLSGAAATVLHLYLRARTPSFAQSPYSSILSLSSRRRPNTSSRRPPPLYERPPPPYQKPKSIPHNRKGQLGPPQPDRANRLSSFTARSFHRLGDEVAAILSSIRPALSPASSPKPPHHNSASSTSRPARDSPLYTLFPPIPARYRPLTDKPQGFTSTPTPPMSTGANKATPPHRPSRAATPIVNMSRSQASPKIPERALLAERKRGFLAPAVAIEVAIPPGGRERDVEDAESFREILIWKGGGEVSAQEVVVGRFF